MSDARVNISEVLPTGWGEDPLAEYTRLFTRFLQLVFGSFEKGSFQWVDDPLLSDIIIQAESTVATEVVEKRPAIIVQRGPVAFTNVTLDQFAGPLLDPKTGRVTHNLSADGTRRHTDLLMSSATFNCLSCEGLEAQRIAWTCAYATRTLKRTLMRAGLHRVGEDIQVGAETSPGAVVQPDSNEIVMVSVSVPFFFQQTWSVGPLDKTLLTRVGMAIRSEVEANEPAPTFNGPSMNGQPLDGKAISIDQILTGSGSESQ
jgi:hypothetical protein